MPLSPFRARLNTPDPLAAIRAGLIGADATIPGPDGPLPLIYADHVASGRALVQVEDFIRDHLLPWYANTHSEDSWCGAHTTRLREAARAEIARITGADDDCAVIFAGSGATAGLNRLVGLLGVDQARAPVVLHGPYEHHANILPWRESGARVVEIPEAPAGGPDLDALEAALRRHAGSDLVIGAFSAASNVTGIVTDQEAVTRLLKRHGALAVWDHAAAAPYLPIEMGRGDTARDAVVFSAHKFPGGPGASGVLILRRGAVRRKRPVWPGGGAVAWVSPWGHDWLEDVVRREEAGTPNIPGDIRAGLVLMVKEAVGQARIARIEARWMRLALAAWQEDPNLTLLGAESGAKRLPIFSFLVSDGRGGHVDHGLFTRLLSRHYGIQARGGCSCAGPYGHRLLGVGRARSEALREAVRGGRPEARPGWVRLNFSWLMDEATVRRIVEAVSRLAARCAAGEFDRPDAAA